MCQYKSAANHVSSLSLTVKEGKVSTYHLSILLLSIQQLRLFLGFKCSVNIMNKTSREIKTT